MKKKSLTQFIKNNRTRIDEYIAEQLDHPVTGRSHRQNDTERINWILNDEGLYNWAKSEGVNV